MTAFRPSPSWVISEKSMADTDVLDVPTVIGLFFAFRPRHFTWNFAGLPCASSRSIHAAPGPSGTVPVISTSVMGAFPPTTPELSQPVPVALIFILTSFEFGDSVSGFEKVIVPPVNGQEIAPIGGTGDFE